jgi:hypothetical protein
MKAKLLKRFSRVIASSDQEAIDKLTYLVIEEECNRGHTLLADQLENIIKTHIRHHKVPQREITERKNPREHKNKHMQ